MGCCLDLKRDNLLSAKDLQRIRPTAHVSFNLFFRNVKKLVLLVIGRNFSFDSIHIFLENTDVYVERKWNSIFGTFTKKKCYKRMQQMTVRFSERKTVIKTDESHGYRSSVSFEPTTSLRLPIWGGMLDKWFTTTCIR